MCMWVVDELHEGDSMIIKIPNRNVVLTIDIWQERMT